MRKSKIVRFLTFTHSVFSGLRGWVSVAPVRGRENFDGFGRNKAKKGQKRTLRTVYALGWSPLVMGVVAAKVGKVRKVRTLYYPTFYFSVKRSTPPYMQKPPAELKKYALSHFAHYRSFFDQLHRR